MAGAFSASATRWDRAEAIAVGDRFEWVSGMSHRAYLRRPFDVSDAVRALRSGSTRVSELRFGPRDNLNAIDCGKIGRSVVSSRIIRDLATRCSSTHISHTSTVHYLYAPAQILERDDMANRQSIIVRQSLVV